MLTDAGVPEPLKGRLIATIGESAGSDADAVLIAALARTNSTLIFDQFLKRPESSLALLAAMKEGKVTPASLGPANVARLRTHPNRQVAQQAAVLLDTLSPATKVKAELIATLAAGSREARRRRQRPASVHRRLFELPQARRHRQEPGRSAARRHGRARTRRTVDAHPRSEPRSRSQLLAVERDDAQGAKHSSASSPARTRPGSRSGTRPATWRSRRTTSSTRENTRRSLMPEGLEALGAEALRDILSVHGRQCRRVPRRRSAPGLHGRQPARLPPRRGARRHRDAPQVRGRYRGGRAVLRHGPGAIAERREPGGAQGRTRQRESLGRFPAARRDSDVGHRGEPALPRRGRRLGVADRRRRGSRQARDEGHRALRRRHDRGARAQERRAHRRHVRPRGRAAQRRRRRFHAPRAAALLRAEPAARRARCRRSCSRASTPTSCRPRSRSRLAPSRAAVKSVFRPPTAGSGWRRGREHAGPEGRRTRRRPAARDQADRLGARQDEGAHHRRRQLAQLRAVLRRDRPRHARRPPDSA